MRQRQILVLSVALLLLALLLVLGGGHAYHVNAQAGRRAALVLPGRWVAVEGRSLYMDCRGTGHPTVVLESGATAFAASWDLVARPLSSQVRVCAYDRAGLGWSPAAGTAYEPAAAARDLHAALQVAGEHPPYAVVGHSLGAMFAILFAEAHATEIHSLVLLDPPHPDMLAALPALAVHYNTMLQRLQVGAWLVRSGVPDAFGIQNPLIESFPPEVRAQAAYLVNDPGHLRAAHAELLAWPAIARAVSAAHGFRSRPTLVISPGAALNLADGAAQRAALNRLQADYVTGVGHSAQVVLAGVAHDSMLFDDHLAQSLAERIGSFIRQVP